MTTTTEHHHAAESILDDLDLDAEIRCEATWTCPDCGAEQCDHAATERVTVRCAGCGDPMRRLLCRCCADATEQRPVFVSREPL
jgi:hypothetical protein